MEVEGDTSVPPVYELEDTFDWVEESEECVEQRLRHQ
jgi:hypothetical protein